MMIPEDPYLATIRRKFEEQKKRIAELEAEREGAVETANQLATDLELAEAEQADLRQRIARQSVVISKLKERAK